MSIAQQTKVTVTYSDGSQEVFDEAEGRYPIGMVCETTTTYHPPVKSRCPSCFSTAPSWRGMGNECEDPWHDAMKEADDG